MIYIFSWNNHVALKNELQKWKERFLEKFWDFNFFHLTNIYQIEKVTLHEILVSWSFLWQKKLVLVELPEPKNEEEWWDTSIDSYLENIIEQIPQENIVVFYTNILNERHSLHKKLSQIGEARVFSISQDESSISSYLAQKYSELWRQEIDTIVKLKSGNLEKSLQEIEKLLTYSETPTVQDIFNNITPEPEESIFQFTNALFNQTIAEIHTSYQKLQEQMNFYYFYNSLLGSLRTTIFIENLRGKNFSPAKIDETLKLWKKSFLITKRYKLSRKKIEELYISIIKFDRKMKTGYTVGNQEEELFKELEINIILSLSLSEETSC